MGLDSKKMQRNKEQRGRPVRCSLTFIASSIRTGGTFSPPAVMISSLMRPVICSGARRGVSKEVALMTRQDRLVLVTDCCQGNGYAQASRGCLLCVGSSESVSLTRMNPEGGVTLGWLSSSSSDTSPLWRNPARTGKGETGQGKALGDAARRESLRINVVGP